MAGNGGDLPWARESMLAEILKRFGMEDCKPMATPYDNRTGRRVVHSEETDVVDPTIYRQLIGSLMYLDSGQHQARHLLRCQHHQLVHGGAEVIDLK
jgi:hypothetical protein